MEYFLLCLPLMFDGSLIWPNNFMEFRSRVSNGMYGLWIMDIKG